MSSLLGIDSYSQGKASVEASKQAAMASIYAAQLQQQQYQQTRTDLSPWLTTGAEALNTLSGMVKAGPGTYEKSPYYDFLMGEGTKALERGASARGKLASGEEGKALTSYGQNLANTDYQTWLANWYQSLTPYQSLSQLGQTTGTQLGTLGATSAAQAGQNIANAGAYQAAGTLGVGNTLANQQSAWQNFLMGGGGGGGGGVGGLGGSLLNSLLTPSGLGNAAAGGNVNFLSLLGL